jgi:hypothetical protein
MKRRLLALFVVLLFASLARAEYQRLEISIFGMD